MSEQQQPPLIDAATGVADTGHDYDGIRELDNNLPNWWLFVLFATIVFGFGYYLYYESFDVTPGQMDEYAAELEEAKAMAAAFAASRGAATDEMLVEWSKDVTRLAEGKTAYGQFCASCHAASGEGLIGPNLTDAYWLHGAKPTEVLKVVSAGVPSKGMPAWETVLGLTATENVVAYLLTIQNTNKPGKEPQGVEVTQR